MKNLELKIAYNRFGESLDVAVGDATFTTAADSGIKTFVEWLGDQLINHSVDAVVLDAQPYDESKMVDAHIVTLRVPVKDEVSRE